VQALGTSALKSAAKALGRYFDAESSALHSDLERLVLGAYVATKNTLSETTMFSTQSADIPNAMMGNDSQILPGAGDFVIYDSGVSALSIPLLIAVPLILTVLLGIIFLTTSLLCYAPPLGNVDALKATILYSSLDLEDQKDDWVRKSSTPFWSEVGGGTECNAYVQPIYNRESRTLSWQKTG
jgi:hypothetical protein